MLLEEPRPSFGGGEAEPFPFNVGSADGCQLGPHPFPARVIARPVAQASTFLGPEGPCGALTLVTVPEIQRPSVRPARQGGRVDLFLGTEKSVQCTADNHIGQAVDIKSVQYIARD